MLVQNITVGQFLRKRREERKVSLESVARFTRINLGRLEALERDEFHLPRGEVFIRGYLRSYAKFIELNPEEVIALYQHQIEAKRNQFQDIIPDQSSRHSFLKSVLNLFLNIVYTIAGATHMHRRDKVDKLF